MGQLPYHRPSVDERLLFQQAVNQVEMNDRAQFLYFAGWKPHWCAPLQYAAVLIAEEYSFVSRRKPWHFQVDTLHFHEFVLRILPSIAASEKEPLSIGF